ncbi:MAG: phosphoserine phosphatase RsbU/P [Verrucomicrobiota bacterium]|jgi:DNA-binding response OmpR family regulator
MKILIAEDDAISRRLLQATLTKWGHEVLVTTHGGEAWQALQEPGAPPLWILDWLMPGLDGVEICRRARAHPTLRSAHIILLTARTNQNDIVEGLQSGADDYVTKPFDHAELRARVQAGVRIVTLQEALAARVRELEEAMASVQTLQGLLPICCYCKKIRDDGNYWHRVESYISGHANVRFSHGICPDCSEQMKTDLLH